MGGGGVSRRPIYFSRSDFFFREPAAGGIFWDFHRPDEIFLTENSDSGTVMIKKIASGGLKQKAGGTPHWPTVIVTRNEPVQDLSVPAISALTRPVVDGELPELSLRI